MSVAKQAESNGANFHELIYDALLASGKITASEKNLLRQMRPVWRIYLNECNSDTYPVYGGLLPVPTFVNTSAHTQFNAFVFEKRNGVFLRPKLVNKFMDKGAPFRSKKGSRRRDALVIQEVLNRRAAHPIVCTNIYAILGVLGDSMPGGNDDAPEPTVKESFLYLTRYRTQRRRFRKGSLFEMQQMPIPK